MCYLTQMLQQRARLRPSIGSRHGRLGRPRVPGSRRMVDLWSLGGRHYRRTLWGLCLRLLSSPAKEKNIRRKLRLLKGKIQDLEKAVQRTEE